MMFRTFDMVWCEGSGTEREFDATPTLSYSVGRMTKPQFAARTHPQMRSVLCESAR